MAIGDVFEVVTYSTLDMQTALTVNHLRVVTEAGDPATPFSVGQAFSDLTQNAYKSLMTARAQYWGVACQRIFPLPKSVKALYRANVGLGTAGIQAMPKQIAGYFNLNTGFSGRNQLSRKYIPFPDENDNHDDTAAPTAGYMTRLGILAAQHFAGLAIAIGAINSTLENIVWHRGSNTANALTGATAKQKWATQRRRGDFGRTNPAPV